MQWPLYFSSTGQADIVDRRQPHRVQQIDHHPVEVQEVSVWSSQGTATPWSILYIMIEPIAPPSTASPLLSVSWDAVQLAQGPTGPMTWPVRCQHAVWWDAQMSGAGQAGSCMFRPWILSNCLSHCRPAHLTTRHCLARSSSAAAALASTRSAASCRCLSMVARSPTSCSRDAQTSVLHAKYIRQTMLTRQDRTG